MKHRSLLRTSFVPVAVWCAAALLCSNASAQREQLVELQVGAEAPDITLTGIDGKEFQLSDVTKSGKNVALMFSRAHW
jgi:hypothetical protein